MTFLGIGECMLELAPHGDGLFQAGFAGDTFNTVWYVAQTGGAGIRPAYFTAVGDDAPSRDMLAFMQDAGITPQAATRAGRSVGLYMIALQNGERSFSYWRDQSAARTLADDLQDFDVAKGDIAYFSGITLAILPPQGRSTLLAALSRARAAGATVVFDPNLRPRLWASADDMRHWTTLGAASADICMPSFEDEAQHFGDATPEATCARYASGGSTTVVVKNGPAPITILHEGAMQSYDVPPVADVVDTTAAGDSFNAGWLVAYMQGTSCGEATTSAAALSAKVIAARGALVR